VPDLEAIFLEDGGQSAEDVATRVSAFVASAERTLEVAIYDFHARKGASAAIGDALEASQARGVQVRVAFNVERDDRASAPRPMAEDPEVIDGLEVPTRGVQDQGALMHHKYVVADGRRVLTGSTNWTDDAFTREENVLVTLDSPVVAAAYLANFEELWRRERLEGSGSRGDEVTLENGVRVTPWFLPSPPSVAHMAAQRIGDARRRIRICSPVVTAGPVLGTLAEFAGRDAFDLDGAYDRTQMDEVQEQWEKVPWNRWKIAAWQTIAPRLSGKVSTPYRPGSIHDYFHAKFVVADDEVIAGSYNLSKGGEENAENVLHMVSEEMAVRFTAYADTVAARYRASAVSP
jgi:phosphatidylserine/phosphatidylglycerophosphate/cardiolipin synthase-like enzyme